MRFGQPRKIDSSRPGTAESETLGLDQIRAQLLARKPPKRPAESWPYADIRSVLRSVAGAVLRTRVELGSRVSAMTETLTRTAPLAASGATTVTMRAARSTTALMLRMFVAARKFAERFDFPVPPAPPSTTPTLQEALIDDASVRHDREIQLARLRLAARESARGFNDPDVASELHLLGALEHEVGRFNEALGLYSTALLIRQRTLGSDHPEVAATLADIEAARRDEADSETEADVAPR